MDAFGSFCPKASFFGGERMERFKKWRVLLLVCIGLILCSAMSADALDVTLQWDANKETDLAGYRVYYRAGASGSGVLTNYDGTGANEGDSPIEMLLAEDENADPDIVEFTVSNLSDGQTYFFVVTAYDNEDPSNESGPSNEADTASATPDTTPPVISNLQVASKTDTTAVIVWTTDEPSDSEVQYGTSTATWENYPSSATDASLVSNHSMTLTGLSQNATYYFRVGSSDASGNGPSVSTEATFTTGSTLAGQNVALNKPVTAGSTDWGTLASYMVDGIWDEAGLAWAADAVPNWVEIDLEGEYQISKINVGPFARGNTQWHYNEAWNIKYKSSTDTEWKDFTSVVKLSGAGTLQGPGISITNGDPGHGNSDDNYKYYSFSFDPVAVRYIRYEVTEGDSDSDANRNEIEIYTSSPCAVRPTGLRISNR